ncbi:hypothetical protein PR048_006118 [Dryococelus australis]|uniref:Uncharacterized protein n=1 Tax=Dryococelus australis TaxID=614101 RepID=A0ABQ9IA26_9NEOP|nr:hypothetical protein PR048_006118 [Dryococelus australis]
MWGRLFVLLQDADVAEGGAVADRGSEKKRRGRGRARQGGEKIFVMLRMSREAFLWLGAEVASPKGYAERRGRKELCFAGEEGDWGRSRVNDAPSQSGQLKGPRHRLLTALDRVELSLPLPLHIFLFKSRVLAVRDQSFRSATLVVRWRPDLTGATVSQKRAGPGRNSAINTRAYPHTAHACRFLPDTLYGKKQSRHDEFPGVVNHEGARCRMSLQTEKVGVPKKKLRTWSQQSMTAAVHAVRSKVEKKLSVLQTSIIWYANMAIKSPEPSILTA